MSDPVLGLLAVGAVLVGCGLAYNARRFGGWLLTSVVIVGGAFVAKGETIALGTDQVVMGAALIILAIALAGTFAGEQS